MQYYSVRMGSTTYEDMDILLSSRSGEVDLYLSTDWDARPKLDPATGEVTGALLSSTEDGDDRLHVKHGRFPACDKAAAGCYYILGVLGRRAGENSFSVVASQVDATVMLQEGVAVRDVVGDKVRTSIDLIDSIRWCRVWFRCGSLFPHPKSQSHPQNYLWYRFVVMDVDTDLSISVTPFSGDPDVYVGFNPKPTKDDHVFAARGFGAGGWHD